MATTSIEELAAGPGFWFQLYVQRDRGVTRALVERAAAAGSPILCVTVDVVVQGRRERDLRNGFTVPPRITARNALDFLAPGLALAHGDEAAQNLRQLRAGAGPGKWRGGGVTTVARQIAAQFDQSVTWQDLAWLRDLWPGKLVVKGILAAEDARRALTCGADGVVVSNHGGRQLDAAVSSIAALPAVVEAVGEDLEVLLDSGVRRGDIVKAMALGARACLVGRAFLYGLAAGGKAGVGQALGILRDEVDTVQALLGCPDLAGLDRSFLFDGGADWPANR